jgi:hypothetical protein
MRKKTHAEFAEQANERNIDVIGTYVDDVTKIRLRCQTHDYEWMMAPGRVISGRGCKKCGLERLARKLMKTNKVIADFGDWVLIDISIPTHPDATMAVDKQVWDNYDGGRVSGYVNRKYIEARCKMAGETHKFHQLVAVPPPGKIIDHKVHGTATFVDNRRSNLRFVTNSQNMMNQAIRVDNKSGVTGVYLNKQSGKWVARICVEGKEFFLGYHTLKKNAIKARKRAEKKYFGKYAYSANNK